MQPILITWQDLLIALVAVLAVYIAEVLLLFRYRARKDKPEAASRTDAEVEALRAELHQLREQMLVLKQGLERGPPPAQAEMPAVTGTAYAQAMELARQGVDGDVLAARCGMSRAEAELILALHRARGGDRP